MMKNKKSNNGFTLVELIVVIVILAILAAILVPALLGYIDRAKEKQDMFKARNMLQASQAVLTEFYAKGISPKEGRKDDNDVSTAFAKEVRKIADDEPYLAIVGYGDYRDNDTTGHDAYTACFVIYWESVDKEPLFFNGSEWSMDYPWPENKSGKDNNYFTINGKRECVTFVFVSNKTNEPNVWSYLQKTIKKNNRKFGQESTTKSGK